LRLGEVDPRRFPMTVRTRSTRGRLQDLLERLRPGDELQVAAASRRTGVDATMCETVLEALVRVGLFTRSTNGVFVRCRMFEALERLQV
jgi:hypothetical protein